MLKKKKKKRKVTMKDKCVFGNVEQVTYTKVLFNWKCYSNDIILDFILFLTSTHENYIYKKKKNF